MAEKKYALTREHLRPLAPGRGSCLATDEIVVRGRKVGYLYREAPDRSSDSGWRFLAGDESPAYMDNPDHMGIYDVNTIANYDADIIPLLDAPIGSAYIRDRVSGRFVLDTGSSEPGSRQ